MSKVRMESKTSNTLFALPGKLVLRMLRYKIYCRLPTMLKSLFSDWNIRMPTTRLANTDPNETYSVSELVSVVALTSSG